MADEHADLHAMATPLGLPDGFLQTLISQLGPVLAQFLIKMLLAKQSNAANVGVTAAQASGGFDPNMMKTLVVNLLKQYKPQVLTLLTSLEDQLIDQLITSFGG